MHSIGSAEKGDVDIVVDDEQAAGVPGQLAEPAGQREQFAAREDFVPELDHVGASAQHGFGQRQDTIGFLVGGDDVQPGRLKPT